MQTDTQIIPIHRGAIDGEVIDTVNARELHAFLGIGRDYTTWINARIEKFGFAEGADFVMERVFPGSGENSKGGRPALEYHLTLDMAKELAMVENNDQGRAARRYFIEMERRAKATAEPLNLDDPKVLRRLLLEHNAKVEAAEAALAEAAPKVAALTRIAEADGSQCITDAAKTLQVRPKDLFSWLRANGWIYRRAGNAHDCAYQSKLQQGLMEHKVTIVSRTDGTEKTVEQARITPKGLARLAEIFPSV